MRIDAAGDLLADRYELSGRLGSGAMGEVWLGWDRRLTREVAVKVLHIDVASDSVARARFDAEARAAAGLNHPNVVAVFDYGEHEGAPFLVMERLPGSTLADEVTAGPLASDRAVTVAVELLDALDAAHAAGVLHRDIKPGNVLASGRGGNVKLGDFGIAKTSDNDLTATGDIIGTVAYLAPERVAGAPATVQSDLWSLGVVLYEAASGRRPFPGDTPLAVMHAIHRADAPPLRSVRPELPAAFTALVDRAMAREPSDRFASAADMRVALVGTTATTGDPPLTEVSVPPAPTELLAYTPRHAPAPASVPVRPPPPRSRPPIVVAVVVALMLVLVVALALGDDEDGQEAPSTSVPAGLDDAIDRLEEMVDE